MKLLLILTTLGGSILALSGCAWFGSRKPPPDPSEIIVTGAPGGSSVFIDGVPAGQTTAGDDHPQIIRVLAGDHRVEIHVGDKMVYREETYVGHGEHRVIKVLSGLNR